MNLKFPYKTEINDNKIKLDLSKGMSETLRFLDSTLLEADLWQQLFFSNFYVEVPFSFLVPFEDFIVFFGPSFYSDTIDDALAVVAEHKAKYGTPNSTSNLVPTIKQNIDFYSQYWKIIKNPHLEKRVVIDFHPYRLNNFFFSRKEKDTGLIFSFYSYENLPDAIYQFLCRNGECWYCGQELGSHPRTDVNLHTSPDAFYSVSPTELNPYQYIPHDIEPCYFAFLLGTKSRSSRNKITNKQHDVNNKMITALELFLAPINALGLVANIYLLFTATFTDFNPFLLFYRIFITVLLASNFFICSHKIYYINNTFPYYRRYIGLNIPILFSYLTNKISSRLKKRVDKDISQKT